MRSVQIYQEKYLCSSECVSTAKFASDELDAHVPANIINVVCDGKIENFKSEFSTDFQNQKTLILLSYRCEMT